ncbi:MAG: penicillin-binding protein 2 [bacterium]
MSIKKTENRIIIIFISFLFLFSIIISRLYYLQIYKHTFLSEVASKQYKQTISLTPKRGTIYDCNGRALAISLDVDSVYITNLANKVTYEEKRKICKILGLPFFRLNKILKSSSGFTWLKRKATPREIFEIKNLNITGVGLVKESKRFYPKKSLAGHLLGFAGIDNIGLEGIELLFDKYIKGESGIIITEKDAFGRSLLDEVNETRELRSSSIGCDVYLTLDETIQYITEKELYEMCFKLKAKSGNAIVMDPNTGEILAMANYPSFNPNVFYKSKPNIWRNKCITDPFEPGSIMKVITSAAALEENIAKPEDVVFCENGAIEIGGIVIHDSIPYGWLSFNQVIEKSSNIGMIKIGAMLGKERLYRYIDKFGLLNKTSVELPGETVGIVRRLNDWSAASIGAISIGQEASFTPLQFITAISAVANGGNLMRPIIVKSVTNHRDNGPIATFNPTIVRQVLSTETCITLSQILSGVINNGTGKEAAINGYQVAGKTGTAQKIDPVTRKYSNKKFIASFVGYVPAFNPRIAILVSVDEPKDKIYGGSVAAPIFSRIGAQTLRYLKVPPNDDTLRLVRANNESDSNESESGDLVSDSRVQVKTICQNDLKKGG